MRKFLQNGLVVLGLLMAGCASGPVGGTRVGIYAELTTSTASIKDIKDARIKAVVKNHGPLPSTINAWIMGNAPLSLETRDAQGEVLDALPPSSLPEDLDRYERTLKPGESVTFTYQAYGYPDNLPPGKYRVRMRHVPSSETGFTIQP